MAGRGPSDQEEDVMIQSCHTSLLGSNHRTGTWNSNMAPSTSSVASSTDAGTTPSPPSPSALFVSALSGATIAGIALHFATRGRFSPHAAATTDPAFRQLLETTLRHNQDAMLQHVQHGLSESTLQMKSSLLSQQSVLQQSLQPVAVATQQLSHMQNDVSTLKNVLLHAPTARGRSPLFGGEFQLEALLRHALPTGQFAMQYTFAANGKRVDGMVRTPVGKLAIDCKFPLGDAADVLGAVQRKEEEEAAPKNETQSSLPDAQETSTSTSAVSSPSSPSVAEKPPIVTSGPPSNTATAAKQKKLHSLLNKHIDDIAKKYIIPGETVDYAILFLPSEAVLLHILENDTQSTLLLRAHRQRVYLACPTTLLLLLTQLYGSSSQHGIQNDASSRERHKRVQALLADTDRLVKRFQDTDKALQKATAELAKMQISMDKIQRQRALLEADDGWMATTTTTAQPNDTTKNTGAAVSQADATPNTEKQSTKI